MAAREMKMEDINQRQLLTEPHFQQMLEVLSDSAKDTVRPSSAPPLLHAAHKRAAARSPLQARACPRPVR